MYIIYYKDAAGNVVDKELVEGDFAQAALFVFVFGNAADGDVQFVKVF